MNQKFSKKELERLGCTEDQIKLVMECQRKLPIIFDNENDDASKFCVDARTLWDELESNRQFSDWINQKIKKCKIQENVDYKTFSLKCEKPNGGRPTTEFSLTMRIAEHFCMLQNNEIGFKMRDYFILMENLIKRNKKWWKIRNPQRENYKKMCNAISESIHRIFGRDGDEYDFKREADIINLIAVGSRAQSIKNYLGVAINAKTRDSLLSEYNEKISFLQEQNILLLGMDMPIIKRVLMLINFFDIKYPNAKPIQDYYDKDYMIKARENLIKELENR